MHERRHLDLRAADGAELPHAFLAAGGGSETLALLFPGRGYRATMPLLYYAERALLWRGADVLRLDLAYDLDPAFARATPAGRRERIHADADRACRLGLAQGDYRHLVLVGKSLGTLALADLLTGAAAGRSPACVWLTPLLGDAGMTGAISRTRPPSLFVIGSADPLYDAEALGALAAGTGGRSLVVEGADHGLEVPGDLRATLAGLAAYGTALEELLDASGISRAG